MCAIAGVAVLFSEPDALEPMSGPLPVTPSDFVQFQLDENGMPVAYPGMLIRPASMIVPTVRGLPRLVKRTM